MRRVAIWITLLLTLTSLLNGQGLTGQISGSVVDQTGSRVPGAKVELLNSGTGLLRKVDTDASGNFVFVELLAGTYQVTVTAAGFKQYVERNVLLTATERVTLHQIALEVGELSQNISVLAEGARVQTESSERSGVTNGDQLSDLSLKGRDYLATVHLLPGVIDTADRDQPGFNDLVGIAVHGFRSGSINLTFDGISSMDSGSMTGPYLAPGLDSIAEVKVLLANYQAEYGRSASGSINIIIKSGSKDLHGEAFYFNRNEAYNADNFFNNRSGIARPLYRFNWPGYNVGGPVLIPHLLKNREKLFFFWSQEWTPRTSPSTIGTLTMPTALERQGNFSQTVSTSGAMIPITDPLANGTPFPGNVIPANRIDKNGQTLLNVFPMPNAYDPAHTYNYIAEEPIDHPRHDSILRIDYNVSPKTVFYARGIMDYEAYKGDYGFLFASSVWPQFPINYLVSSKGLVSTLIHTFSPTLVNEFTFGVNRSLQLVSPLTPTAWNSNNRADIGLNIPQFYPQCNPYNLIPNAYFGGVTNAPSLVEDSRMPFYGRNQIWDYTDNLSKIWGPHNVKVGVYVERGSRPAAAYAYYFNGSFDFTSNVNNPLNTNYAFSNAMLGSVNSYSEQDNRYGMHGEFGQVEWFAQDNWKVSHRLTLDIGVRFYSVGAVNSPGNQLASFFLSDWNPSAVPQLIQPYLDPTTGVREGRNPYTGQIVSTVKIGTLAIGSGNIYNGMQVFNGYIMHTPPIQVAPRLGFAWDVFGNGKTAVRGGFGFFPDRYTDDWVVGPGSNLVANPPVINTLTANYTTISGLLSTPLSLSPSTVGYINRDPTTLTAYNGSFGVQQALGRGVVLDVAYVASLGRHLQGSYDINAEPYGTDFLPSSIDHTLAGSTFLPPNFLRPIKGYADIKYYGLFESCNYNSMETQVNRSFTKNFRVQANWTWSKAMDMASTINPFLNPRMRNYGKSSLDRTHNMVVNYDYMLPRVSQHWNNGFTRWVLDNWVLSGITSFVSGAPVAISYSFVNSTDIMGGTGTGMDTRVILTGNPNLPRGQRNSLVAFKTSVVEAPLASNGTIDGIGNAAPDNVRGPGINNWDMSLLKNIPFGKEGVRHLQLRAETYNTFNHTQFLTENSAAQFNAAGVQTNARFGQYLTARDPRQMQFGLKFYF